MNISKNPITKVKSQSWIWCLKKMHQEGQNFKIFTALRTDSLETKVSWDNWQSDYLDYI
jgi:hypothetical protein